MMDICKHCGWEVDLETCQCGDGKDGHPYDVGHNFVPAGCTCGYLDADKFKNPALLAREAPGPREEGV